MIVKSEDKTLKILQREKIGIKLNIAQPEWSEKQKQYIDLVRDKDSKIIFLRGGAGTGKTFQNIWLALELLNQGRIQEIICVRSLVESGSSQLGFLPGTALEKLQPYSEPFLDKFRQFIRKEQLDALIKDERIKFLPINHLRGREFNASFIYLDEAQNLGIEELQTFLTRIGMYSKMILSGDDQQSDLEIFKNKRSGFRPFFDWYNTDNAKQKGIMTFSFGLEDIRREPIIAFIIESYKAFKNIVK